MTLTDELLARFEAAAEKTLLPAQQQAFENDLAANADLRAEYVAYCQLRHSIESIQLKKQLVSLHEQLAATGQLADDNVPEAEVRPMPASRRWAWAAAAALALMLGTLWWLLPAQKTDTQALYVAYYRPEPVMRGPGDCGPSVAEAVMLYRKQRYTTALQQLANPTPGDACTAYYRGLCQLALRQPEAALSLRSAQRWSSGSLKQRADWYLAMSYLATNNPDEARRQLAEITNVPDHAFGLKALEVLAQLTP